jgi:ketopantoate reductase
MRIGILGSGLMGGKLGTIFARAGHDGLQLFAQPTKAEATCSRGAGARAGCHTA